MSEHARQVAGRWVAGMRVHRLIGPRHVFMILVITAVFRPALGDLEIHVMPVEHLDYPLGKQQFTQQDYKKEGTFPWVEIKNKSPKEWAELRIGSHAWLLGQLNAFGKSRGETIHVRFLNWPRAWEDITRTYQGDCQVLMVPSTWMAALAKDGILAPLECDANDQMDLADYPPKLLNTCRLDPNGPLYARPWHRDFRVLYYTSALAKDPNDLVEYTSFKDCLVLRQKIMKSAGEGNWVAPVGIGLSPNEWDMLHGPLNWAFGGLLVQEVNGGYHGVCHKKPAIDGLRHFWELSQSGCVAFTAAAEGKLEWEVLAEALHAGRFDAVIGGPWMRIKFADRPDIRAAPLPRMIDGQDHTFLGGSHLGVTTAALRQHRAEASRELIRYLARPEASTALYLHTDSMPARDTAFRQFLAENPRWSATFERAMNAAEPYPVHPGWARGVEVDTVRGLCHTLLDSVAKQGGEWDAVSRQAEALADVLTEALPPPPPPPPPTSIWEKIWAWLTSHHMDVLILAAVVAVAVIANLILRHTRDIIHAVQTLGDEAKKAETVVCAAIEEAKGVLIIETDEHHHAVIEDLQSMRSDLRTLRTRAQEFPRPLSADESIARFQHFTARLDRVEATNRSIIQRYPGFESHMVAVSNAIRDLRRSADRIARRLNRRAQGIKVKDLALEFQIVRGTAGLLSMTIQAPHMYAGMHADIEEPDSTILLQAMRGRLYEFWGALMLGSPMLIETMQRSIRTTVKEHLVAILADLTGERVAIDSTGWLPIKMSRKESDKYAAYEFSLSNPIRSAVQSRISIETRLLQQGVDLNQLYTHCVSAMRIDPGDLRLWRCMATILERNSGLAARLGNALASGEREWVRHSVFQYLRLANMYRRLAKDGERAEKALGRRFRTTEIKPAVFAEHAAVGLEEDVLAAVRVMESLGWCPGGLAQPLLVGAILSLVDIGPLASLVGPDWVSDPLALAVVARACVGWRWHSLRADDILSSLNYVAADPQWEALEMLKQGFLNAAWFQDATAGRDRERAFANLVICGLATGAFPVSADRNELRNHARRYLAGSAAEGSSGETLVDDIDGFPAPDDQDQNDDDE